MSDADRRRRAVLETARKRGENARIKLLKYITDDDPLVREWAVEGLVRRKAVSQEVVDSLLHVLVTDVRVDLRWYAARALGRLGVKSKDVVDGLLSSLTHSDIYVRCFSAASLAQLHASTPTVIKALQKRIKALPLRGNPLECQAIGAALQRLHTTPQKDRVLQLDLPLNPGTESCIPDQLPSTRNQLVDEIRKMTLTTVVDRTGTEVNVARGLSISVRYRRKAFLKERASAERGPCCQICNFTFRKRDDHYYFEAHHVHPLGEHGPDCLDNILVLCANHHRQLHHGRVSWPQGSDQPATVMIDGIVRRIRWTELDPEISADP